MVFQDCVKGAPISTPSKTFRMNSTDCKPGLIAQQQCLNSLMLLRLNGNKSLQTGCKILWKNFQEEWRLFQQHVEPWFWNDTSNHVVNTVYSILCTQAYLGEYRRIWHFTTIQWWHWALHLEDNKNVSSEQVENFPHLDHIYELVWIYCPVSCRCLPAMGAETGTGPGWSDEEGPQWFWVKMNVLSGTLKWSSSEP